MVKGINKTMKEIAKKVFRELGVEDFNIILSNKMRKSNYILFKNNKIRLNKNIINNMVLTEKVIISAIKTYSNTKEFPYYECLNEV